MFRARQEGTKMRHLSRMPVTVAAVAASLALAACGSVSKPPGATATGGTGTTAGGGSAGASSSTFTYDTYTQVMIGWDPSTAYSNEIIAMHKMYETLTTYDSTTQTVKPLLATSWSHNPTGTEWTFHLRHGVHFHTGRLMTSAAVKASIMRTIHLNQGAAYIWASVNSISSPTPYTAVFHLKYPAPLDLIS